MLEAMRFLAREIPNVAEHVLALILIKDDDWHVLFCGCQSR